MTRQWQFVFTVKENYFIQQCSTMLRISACTTICRYKCTLVKRNKQNALKYVGIRGISQVLQLS